MNKVFFFLMVLFIIFIAGCNGSRKSNVIYSIKERQYFNYSIYIYQTKINFYLPFSKFICKIDTVQSDMYGRSVVNYKYYWGDGDTNRRLNIGYIIKSSQELIEEEVNEYSLLQKDVDTIGLREDMNTVKKQLDDDFKDGKGIVNVKDVNGRFVATMDYVAPQINAFFLICKHKNDSAFVSFILDDMKPTNDGSLSRLKDTIFNSIVIE